MTKAVQFAIFFHHKSNNGIKPLFSRGQSLGRMDPGASYAAASNMETDRTRILLARRKPCFFFAFALIATLAVSFPKSRAITH
ncbi:hypothetical protein QLQ09_13295 [Brucella sp. NM4]|uniref:hypothetical protein n=1 Tax=Brucella sp. NM4 TaxID=3045175 RepID=UPI0024BC6BD2|nr:hypothetical protein [Brucella sp. NM4]WHS30843.1 hypothetical protein QLQ09_13295 [Brucella sp. NM4]